MTTTRTTRTLRTTTFAALVATALAVAPAIARAQDDDAEARFHKAYETEVVDGKLADAARVYLALMDDAKAPARIRGEAKFRFAVTAVLLGRSDEARVRLEEIAGDATAPDALRARARSYLDATKGVGVGTELDRKLQELVFELGRTSPSDGSPNVYRDFQVIGKPAVPFLRGLLSHPDLTVRGHAFKLLVKMEEPGMADAWTPELMNSFTHYDFSSYLHKRPSEAAVLRKALLALDDARLAGVLSNTTFRPPADAEFLRAAKARGVAPDDLVRFVAWIDRDEALARLRIEWMSDPDATLAVGATSAVVAAGPKALPPGTDPAAVFRAAVAEPARNGLGRWTLASWRKSDTNSNERKVAEAFVALALLSPQDTVLGALESFAKSPGAATSAAIESPLTNGLADAVAVAVEDRPPERAALKRYADILCAWAEAVQRESRLDGNAQVFEHLRWALERLPRDEAVAALRRLVEVSPQKTPGVALWALAPTARAWELTVALHDTLDARGRMQLLSSFSLFQGTSAPADGARARAMLVSLPAIVRAWAGEVPVGDMPPVAMFHPLAAAAAAEDARAALVGILQALEKVENPRARTYAANLVGGRDRNDAAFWQNVFLPVAEEAWPYIAPRDRPDVLERAVDRIEVPGSREFVTAHADLLSPSAVRKLAVNTSVPLESWVPRAPAAHVSSALGNSHAALRSERTTAAVATMAPDPAAANASVRALVRAGPDEAARAFYDVVLRTAPVDRMQEAILELAPAGAWPSNPPALEDALARLLAVEKPEPGTLRTLVTALAGRQPSEKLFPAIRRMLATPADVQAGIAAAQSLGRPELLPALADKLDSMDEGIRKAARAAIDSIVELGKLKEEAKRRAGLSSEEKR